MARKPKGSSKTAKSKSSPIKPLASSLAAVLVLGVMVYLLVADSGDPASEPSVAQTAATGEANAPLAAKPPVRVEPESVDFGTVRVNATERRIVQLVNTSQRTLQIMDTRSSCGCTTGSVSTRAISPGGSVPLTATFNSSTPGARTANISVSFTGYSDVIQVPTRALVTQGE